MRQSRNTATHRDRGTDRRTVRLELHRTHSVVRSNRRRQINSSTRNRRSRNRQRRRGLDIHWSRISDRHRLSRRRRTHKASTGGEISGNALCTSSIEGIRQRRNTRGDCDRSADRRTVRLELHRTHSVVRSNRRRQINRRTRNRRSRNRQRRRRLDIHRSRIGHRHRLSRRRRADKPSTSGEISRNTLSASNIERMTQCRNTRGDCHR